MSAETDIYDLEAKCESALKALFVGRNLNAYTSQDWTPANADGTPVQDFTLMRPRVEILFVAGPGLPQWTLVNGQPRQTSWKGTYSLLIITEPLISIHSAYRALIRCLMHGAGASINGTAPMTQHKIQPWFSEAGTTVAIKGEDGNMVSTMNFNIDLSVQTDAWATLTT